MECSKNVIIKNVIIALLVERSKNIIIKNVIIVVLVERSKNVIIKNVSNKKHYNCIVSGTI